MTTKKYHDAGYAVPIVIRTYEPGDVFTIDVTYNWNSPADPALLANIDHDYTLSIYAKSSFTITDATSAENELHTEGTKPSAFQVSKYQWPRPPEPKENLREERTIISFYDLN